jgi:hypothetical protein
LAADLCAALADTGRLTAAGLAAAGLASDFAAGLAAAAGFLVGVCDDAAAAHTIAATKAHKSLRISDVLILTGF